MAEGTVVEGRDVVTDGDLKLSMGGPGSTRLISSRFASCPRRDVLFAGRATALRDADRSCVPARMPLVMRDLDGYVA